MKREEIINYSKIGKIKLKSGLFKSSRDPSVDLEREASDFISSQKKIFNEKVSNTFDIESNDFQKFEFFDLDKRASKIDSESDKIDNLKVAFRSSAQVTLLYLKPRSLIIFQTKLEFAITSPGCGGNGQLYYTGGRNYMLEEIYFNKITTVGAQHDETSHQVLNEGCGSGSIATFVEEKDGFVIRAGENFRVFASEKNTQELKAARSMINEKISGTN